MAADRIVAASAALGVQVVTGQTPSGRRWHRVVVEHPGIVEVRDGRPREGASS